MSYYLYDPYFYISKSSTLNSSELGPLLREKSYIDYKSNRISRKGQLIE